MVRQAYRCINERTYKRTTTSSIEEIEKVKKHMQMAIELTNGAIIMNVWTNITRYHSSTNISRYYLSTNTPRYYLSTNT